MKVASLDNVLFLLLIAVAALFQLLSKAASKAGKSDSNETSSSPKPQTPRPTQRQSDPDRIRKFLEALGQPPSSAPPPPVAPRTNIPPRRLAPVQPPPVMPRAWRLPREQHQKPEVTQKESPTRGQPRHSEKIVLPPLPAATAPGFEVHEGAVPSEGQQQPIVKMPVEAYAAATRPIVNRPDFKTDIASLLASKSGLREAILLREIFGPPRSLHELDAAPTDARQ